MPFNIISSDCDLIGLAAVKLRLLQNYRRFCFHLGRGIHSHLYDFPYHRDALSDSSRAFFALVKSSLSPLYQLHPRRFSKRRHTGCFSDWIVVCYNSNGLISRIIAFHRIVFSGICKVETIYWINVTYSVDQFGISIIEMHHFSDAIKRN